ncbi:MAG: hypothetical protein KAT65_14145 [Methanophagales archaeon]|nr:hypothetical protein [Methanophagales archaeon]
MNIMNFEDWLVGLETFVNLKTGKGEETVGGLQGKPHEIMAFQAKISGCVDKMERTEDSYKGG